MTDISKCNDKTCPKKDQCWRWLAPDAGDDQSWHTYRWFFTGMDGYFCCDGYWER